MSIETGRMVELEYTLASPEGEVLETSEGEEPLLYVHGTGELPDMVEKALEGKDVGDSVRVDLGPDELFGAYDPGGIVQVDPAEFPEDAELETGMVLTLQIEGDDEESSGEIDARIVEIRPEAVIIDTNPPLAGKPIVLTAKVLGIGDPD